MHLRTYYNKFCLYCAIAFTSNRSTARYCCDQHGSMYRRYGPKNEQECVFENKIAPETKEDLTFKNLHASRVSDFQIAQKEIWTLAKNLTEIMDENDFVLTKIYADHIDKGTDFWSTNITSDFIEDDIVKIDLQEFEERFIAAHQPIEKTIRILCKDCHRIYDNNKKVHERIPADGNVIDSAEEERLEGEEGKLIERLVKEKSMNKSKAFALARTRSITALTNSNTIFSNVNAAQDVWWLEPHNDKFQTDLYIILNDERSCNLYFFKVPAGSIKSPQSLFKQRNDKYRKNCSDIYIPVSGIKFEEREGFDFSPFRIETINY